MHYRSDIDGLRAIAVISVVLFHADIPGFTGGFVGVDIFFVISGYLITNIIKNSLESGNFSIADFYDRRIRRIFPALFTMYVVTFMIGLVVLTPADLKALAESLLSSAVFAANIHFHDITGYFDSPALNKPLLHTWSLSVEEQFYLLWPLIMVAMVRFSAPQRRHHILLTIFVMSLLYAEWEVWRNNSVSAFYLPHARAWELLTGALIALALPKFDVFWPFREIIAVIGLALIVGSITLFSGANDFPGINAILPCFGTALVIASAIHHPTIVSRILSIRPIVSIGLISYSLYLWHWPFFSYWNLVMERALKPVEALGLITLSLIVAMVSWRYVEKPFRMRKRIALTSKATIRAGMSVIGITVLCGFSVASLDGLPARFGKEVAEILEAADRNWKVSCSNKGDDAALQAECLIGDERRTGSFDVIVMGDSHAQHFAPAVDAALRRLGMSGKLIAKGGCMALFGVRVFHDDDLLDNCTEQLKYIDEFFSDNMDTKLVVIASRWQMYTERTSKTNARDLVDEITPEPSDLESTRQVLRRALIRTIESLTSKGKIVLLVGQVPPYPFTPTNCVIHAIIRNKNTNSCFASTSEIFRHVRYSNELLLKIASKYKNVYTFIPTDVLCNKISCSVFLNDVYLYHDDDHINASGSIQFADYLIKSPAFVAISKAIDQAANQ